MKKLGFVVLAALISMTVNAQKDELKTAEKALKSGDVAAAKSAIDQAEGKLEDKYKGKFYFLKAKTNYELAKKSKEAATYDTAAKAFQDLLAYEKKSGKSKYSAEAGPMLNALISDVSQKGIKEYQAKDFTNAKKSLYQTYTLSKKDTAFLEYAANAAYLDKDFDMALEYFTGLKDLGYTGITTQYTAVNVKTGERENMGSKSQMDLMVKAKEYTDPKSEVSESKKASVVKNIAFILMEKGDNEKAEEAMIEARKADPKDINLLLNHANLYLKLDKKDEFKNLMEEAIAADPNNPSLHFNIGVINQEQGKHEEAKANYNKAIELDAQYSDAYLNLGSLMLEKDKELVEEMNNNLSNFKKYDQIKAKQVELYKEVIPVYEKAFNLKKEKDGKPDVEIARTLMSLYENVGMDDKFKEMKEIWDASKG
ncbi:MAG: tetratricopeptide repeat protein [Flavobacteriaceae bacterium]|nr:tetratricopeptide repeat protein [Flavobacteriaceae bacterium]